MSYNNFLYDCLLQGYKIMGVNQKKIDRMIQLKEFKREYQEFIKDLDLNPIVEYFELGIKARYFKNQVGKVLERNDNLFWGFNHGAYQYTLRRQPAKTTGNTIGDIMNQMIQGRKI